MPLDHDIAGRFHARVYRTSGKRNVHAFLEGAIERAGGRVLYASPHTRAPFYFGVKQGDERLGILVYPFRCTGLMTRNRPDDEHRVQIRLGAEETWSGDHPIALDEAGVDATVIVGAHLEAGIILGLDPLLYDPLPMGISVEFKSAEIETTLAAGWHAWERPNRAGSRRAVARSEMGLETLVAFRPERILDFARFEREALLLRLDPVLRMKAAVAARTAATGEERRHMLEQTFYLTSDEILELIGDRRRLRVAVRGGVAEHHLLRALKSDPDVLHAKQVDSDGPPDAEVMLRDGRTVRIECKNGEESGYADGSGRVEVQKTRASKGDPASRYYLPTQFDVLAVCLWPQDGPPRFVYRSAHDLARHKDFSGRLAVMHRIDEAWSPRLVDSLPASQTTES